MSKSIKFKDNTYLDSTSVSYDRTSLKDFLSQDNTYVTFSSVSGTLAPSGWRNLANNLQLSLKAGTYLFFIQANIVGISTLGLCTIRPMVNGGETARLTIPIQTVISSARIPFIYKFNTDTTITLNVQGYATTNFSVNGNGVYYKKLG